MTIYAVGEGNMY